MKTTMKKFAACLLAMLLAVQIIPAMAEEVIYSSNQVDTSAYYRDKLEITNKGGSYLLINQTTQLEVNEGYTVKWESSNTDVATVDQDGLVTAVGAGEAIITAKENKQSAKENITVINPEQRYKITYTVTYPANAVIQLYPDVAPSSPKNSSFTVQTPPVTGGEAASVELDNGDYNTDNYTMTGWKAADGTVYAKGETIQVSGDIKLTAVFESEYDGGAKKGKSRFLATDNGVTYFTTGAKDKNAPEEYINETWKYLSIYCYPSVDENGNEMYTFRLPEATREVKKQGEGYNLNSENGAAEKTFIGYRLLKILGVDDISAYTDKVYGISEQVTLPRSTTTDGYYFAPVFEEGQTGVAQVRITYNGKTTYIAQGALSAEGIAALAGTEWVGSSWDKKEASIGGDANTAIDSNYLDSNSMPTLKSILRAYGLTAENPADWNLTWYKIANCNTGYYIVGNLVKNKTTVTAKATMVIVINGQRGKLVYNGEEQSFGEYTASSNDPKFDASKVRVVKEGGIAVTRKDCGVEPMKLNASDFAYDDPDVNASFIVSNGWLKITPATVTVHLSGNLEKLWGQDDPDYSEYLVFDGLCGDDTIDVKVTREEGEDASFYRISIYGGDQSNSNYKINFTDGILVITMPPVKIRSSLEGVTEVTAATEITLTAEMDGLDTEHYNIQWQMAEAPGSDVMQDIEGANDITYTYILNESTAGRHVRVVVTLK